MDHDKVLARYDRQMRLGVRAEEPGAVVERDGAVVRHTAPATGWNGVLWSGLAADGSDADAAIAAQVRHFDARGLEFEWKHYAHDHPADLGARLLAAGFTAEPPEALMVAETAAVTAAMPADAPLPEGIRLLPVTDAAGVDLMAEVHAAVFGSDFTARRDYLLGRLTETPGSMAAVVAVAGDRPVSAARLEMEPDTDFAGLWGGGTLREWRGRGIYRSLLAHRARIAQSRGYPYLQVDASADSAPILQRLEFARLSTTTPYVHAPA